MANARASRYEGTAKDEEVEALSAKLRENLRMNIRYMVQQLASLLLYHAF